MSPAPPNRPQARRRQSLWISLLSVVVVSVVWFGAVLVADWHPELGLDLAGGLSVVYQPAHHATQDQLNETVDIMTSRVDALGVTGATVGTQGNNVVVSIPGVKDPNEILKTVGSTAQLYFRPALCYAPAYTPTKKDGKVQPPGPLPATCSASTQLVTTNLTGSPSTGNGVTYSGTPDETLADQPTTPDVYNRTVLLQCINGGSAQSGCGFGGARMLLGPGELKGNIVKSAAAQQTTLGQWVVNMTLTGPGLTAWNTMSQKYFHEMIAIELDGVIQSAPITLPQSSSFQPFTGAVQISGGFTQQQAQNLAIAISYGALPVRLVPQTTQTVSPTLGKSSLKAGLAAGLVGLGLVLLYVILYYRALGLVVVAGLVITAMLLWAIISTLGHSANLSLDLAGVTGLIVSIGITVDSYIVFFERLKDETRGGRSVRTSVDRGFRSAWRTVFAADLVSLIGAVLLWFIAIGEVKGFAFFLGLSTLLDLLVTYFFTRPLVILLGSNERVTEAKNIGISSGLAVGAGVES